MAHDPFKPISDIFAEVNAEQSDRVRQFQLAYKHRNVHGTQGRLYALASAQGISGDWNHLLGHLKGDNLPKTYLR